MKEKPMSKTCGFDTCHGHHICGSPQATFSLRSALCSLHVNLLNLLEFVPLVHHEQGINQLQQRLRAEYRGIQPIQHHSLTRGSTQRPLKKIWRLQDLFC